MEKEHTPGEIQSGGIYQKVSLDTLLVTPYESLTFELIQNVLFTLLDLHDYAINLSVIKEDLNSLFEIIKPNINKDRMISMFIASSNRSPKLAVFRVLQLKAKAYSERPSNMTYSELLGILVTLYIYQGKEENIITEQNSNIA